MSRKPIVIDRDKLKAMMAQGWTSARIADSFTQAGSKVSRATIDKMVREERGAVATSRRPATGSFARDVAALGGFPPAAPSDVDVAGVVEELPSDDEVQAVLAGAPAMNGELLSVCWSEFRSATGPLKATWATRLLGAMTEARRATPPAPPDPNSSPDMVEARKRARKRLHDLLTTSPEEQHR